MGTRRPELVIVASCTQRKTVAAPPALQLRRFRRSLNRNSQWVKALESIDTEGIAAVDLYAGSFWSIIRDLPAAANGRGIRTSLFVASAGYGLVDDNATLKPYSATFASGVDSVAIAARSSDATPTQLSDWWNDLSLWGGPSNYGGPRTIEDAARRSPAASFLVIASPRYVSALAEDLHRAAARLRSPETLVIVSSVSGFPAALRHHLVPSTGVLQAELGGTMGSLHARTARHLLAHSEIPLNATALRTTYEQIASRLAPRPTEARASRTDKQVRSFIRSSMRHASATSCSALLRLHRANGFKCEQKRFRTLFEEEVARS